MATTSRTADKTRSLIIYRSRGQEPVLIEGVPSNAKITFGPVQPGKFGGENVLRIYTSANNQLAVFTNVESFRDLSLKVKERTVTADNSVHDEVGPDGRSRVQNSTERYGWEEVEF